MLFERGLKGDNAADAEGPREGAINRKTKVTERPRDQREDAINRETKETKETERRRYQQLSEASLGPFGLFGLMVSKSQALSVSLVSLVSRSLCSPPVRGNAYSSLFSPLSMSMRINA